LVAPDLFIFSIRLNGGPAAIALIYQKTKNYLHDAQRNVQNELNALRLNGMSSAFMEQDGGSKQSRTHAG